MSWFTIGLRWLLGNDIVSESLHPLLDMDHGSSASQVWLDWIGWLAGGWLVGF